MPVSPKLAGPPIPIEGDEWVAKTPRRRWRRCGGGDWAGERCELRERERRGGVGDSGVKKGQISWVGSLPGLAHGARGLCPAHPEGPLWRGFGLGAPDTVLGRTGLNAPLGAVAGIVFVSGAPNTRLATPLVTPAGDSLRVSGHGRRPPLRTTSVDSPHPCLLRRGGGCHPHAEQGDDEADMKLVEERLRAPYLEVHTHPVPFQFHPVMVAILSDRSNAFF